MRINSVVQELNGEKIDVIGYSQDMGEYISSASLIGTHILNVDVDNVVDVVSFAFYLFGRQHNAFDRCYRL